MRELDITKEDLQGYDTKNMSGFDMLAAAAEIVQSKLDKMKIEEEEDARLELLRRKKGKMKMEEAEQQEDNYDVKEVAALLCSWKKKFTIDLKGKRNAQDEILFRWSNKNRRSALSCKKESNYGDHLQGPSNYMDRRPPRRRWQQQFADDVEEDDEINMSGKKKGHKKRNADDLCMKKKKKRNPSNALVIYDVNDQYPDYEKSKQQKSVKQRKPRKQVHNEAHLAIIPDMPQQFKDKIASMGGRDVKLVIQKVLHMSDLIVTQNRLSMPFKQLRSTFLEPDEIATLAKKDDKGKMESMTVPLIDTRLREREIALVQWTLQTSFWYAFKTQWHTVAVDNEFVEGDVIQIWSFRNQDNRLHFAMILLGRDGQEEAGDAPPPRQPPQELNAVLLPGIVINGNNGESSLGSANNSGSSNNNENNSESCFG